jgi:DNA-binding NarL/FixJ family response regulator
MNFFIFDSNAVRSKGLMAIATEQAIELSNIQSLGMLKARLGGTEPCVALLSEEVFWKICDETELDSKQKGANRVVCLLEEFSLDIAKRLINWGCSAVICWKDVSEIVRCMLTLKESQYYLQPALLSFLLKNNETDENIGLFSRRECEILALIYEECSAKEIANKLHLSVRTVEWHRKRMMEKTGSRNVIGLVKYGLNNKLLLDQN